MWFKNLKLFTLTKQVEFREEQLRENAFRPCGNQDLATTGFHPPIPGGTALTHITDGNTLFCLKTQEKVLPASVVNAELENRCDRVERECGTPVTKKTKSDLKQEIIQEFLPRAFTKDSYTFGVHLRDLNMIVVDAGTDIKAESLLAVMRKSIGSLPVVPLVRRSLRADLTQWLKNGENPWEILEQAKLVSPDENAAEVQFKKQDLCSDEVINHLDNGKLVHELAVEFDETLSCILCEDGTVKKLRFTDVLLEQNDDIPRDEPLARLDADFTLFCGEVTRFIRAMDTEFGLYEQDQIDD